MISFDVSKQDRKLIAAIADRAVAMAQQHDIEYATTDAKMDITAAHANGCKLKLQELAAADGFNFAHDVFGIRQHLNRVTGRLEHHFVPRYAK